MNTIPLLIPLQVCPVAPPGAQQYADQITGYVLWGVGILFIVGVVVAIGAIVKGEKPFDAEVVKASLTTMAEVGKDFPNHFPAGSEVGLDTEASPKIWENPDDFKAKSLKLSADAETVLASMRANPPTNAPSGRFFGQKLASPSSVNATK